MNKNRVFFRENYDRQVKFLLNTYSTIMIIVMQSGASRQYHKHKARNTTTKMMNYVAKKITTRSKTF